MTISARQRARMKPLFFGLFLILLSVSTAHAEIAATAVVSSSSTEFQNHQGGQWRPLPVRGVLQPGDHVRTGAEGRAVLSFSDGHSVKLNGDTEIVIGAPGVLNRTPGLFQILVGEVIARFSPTASNRAAQTPTAVISVRGTEVDIQVARDGASRLAVIVGSADFFNQYGSVVVNAGQESTARPGQVPTPPSAVNVPIIVEWSADLASMAPPLDTSLTGDSLASLRRERQELSHEVSLHPQGPALVLKLANVLHDLGLYAEAMDRYAQAEGAGAPAAIVTVGRAQTSLDSGDASRAADLFKQVLAVVPAGSPERRRALRGLALASLAAGDTNGATANALLLQGEPGGEASSRTIVASVQIRAGDLDDARRTLDAAVQAYPTDAAALALLASVEIRAGDVRPALTHASNAVALASASPRAHAVLAQALFLSGNTDEASKEAEAAVALDPFCEETQLALAEVDLTRGALAGGLRAALKAVTLDPRSARARYLLGLALAEDRRDEEAAVELRQSLKMGPEQADASAVLARVLVNEGRYSEAVISVQDVVDRHPDSSDARAALANVYRRIGRLSDAIAQLEIGAARSPGSALLQAELAQDLADANRLEEALKHAQRAVALQPEAGRYEAILGVIYDRMQSGLQPIIGSGLTPTSEQADRAYREAIALNPADSLARVNLAFEQLAAQGQQNPDFYLSEIAQGLLRDPSVISEVYRPSIRDDIAAGVGTQSSGIGAIDRRQGDNGRFQALTDVGIFHDAGALANSDTDSGILNGYYTLRADSKTNILADVLWNRVDQGLGGAVYNPTPSDSQLSELTQILLGARREIAPGQALWFSLRHRSLGSNQQDSQAALDGTNALASLLNDDLNSAEIRWDGQICRPFLLSVGGSAEEESVNFSQNFFDTTSQSYDLFGTGIHNSRAMGWTEAQIRPDPRVALVAGYRYQWLTSGQQNPQLTGPGGTVNVPLLNLGASGSFPYAMLRLYPVRPLQIRVIALKSQETGITPSLVPQEVFEIVESDPVSFLGRAQTEEVDVEWQRMLDFVRVFGYTSRVQDLSVGPNLTISSVVPTFTIPTASLRGVGVRYERQLIPTVSGFVRWLVSNDTDQSTPASAGWALPLRPLQTINTGLNYVDHWGNKVRILADYQGQTYQDRFWFGDPAFNPGGPRPSAPGVWVASLRLAREPNLRSEVSMTITNLFNAGYSLWPGVPASGIGARLQYEWRF